MEADRWVISPFRRRRKDRHVDVSGEQHRLPNSGVRGKAEHHLLEEGLPAPVIGVPPEQDMISAHPFSEHVRPGAGARRVTAQVRARSTGRSWGDDRGHPMRQARQEERVRPAEDEPHGHRIEDLGLLDRREKFSERDARLGIQ